MQISNYNIPGNGVFPEGIAVNQATGDLYVGSMREGTIFKGNFKQSELQVFAASGTDGRYSVLGMDIDKKGRLFVAGGSTGLVFIYDTTSGKLLHKFDNGRASGDPSTGIPKTFLNDIAISPAGDAYITESFQPILYRIAADGTELETWLDLNNTTLEYKFGKDFGSSMNLNGIVATPDGKYLIVVQTNTGKLFRIDIKAKTAQEIEFDAEPIFGGDGLVLQGQSLYVIHHSETEPVALLTLSADFTKGQNVPIKTQPSFKYPTTAAIYDNHLLVVNGQFNKMGGGADLPFTISSVSLPL